MRRFKVLGIVLLAIVILSTTVFATVGSRTAELFYKDIKILLNGEGVTPKDANGNVVEPFIIDGTTYLPVRGIGNAMGLNVSWDAETNTVVLDKPGIFSGGVVVYDDKNVTIEFVRCREKVGYSSSTYYADFNITNKTDSTLDFSPEAISFDGISYQLSGYGEVAPRSTGKVSFYTYDEILPVSGVSKTSGQISITDWEADILSDEFSRDIKWLDVVKE